MHRLFLLASLAALLLAPSANAVELDWVTLADPGNACDTQAAGCFGSVAYIYRISETEITNAEYAEFLNAVAETDTYGLYSGNMGFGYGGITRTGSSGSYTYSAIAGREEMPVNFVSFYDSLRFANWLHNGQPVGVQDSTTTEDGAYTLLGLNPLDVTRNPGATIFLSSEDEWYKAAYYDAASTSYFDYPARSDTPTICAAPSATANTANCDNAVGDLTDVGSYTGSASPAGTFDQGGNVWEWNETIVAGSNRRVRGGGFDYSSLGLAASSQNLSHPDNDFDYGGFRVAALPEPTPTPTPSTSPTPTATATPTATPTPAPNPLDKDQQKCVNEMNKNGAKVNSTQLKESETCLKSYQKEKLTVTFEQCIQDDLKGKVAKARAKTADKEAKKCTAPFPPFAYLGNPAADAVNDAAEDGGRALTYAIFGGPAVDEAGLVFKSDNKDTAKCQLEMLKKGNKVESTALKEINKEKKAALKDPTVTSNAALQTKLQDRLSSNDKIVKAEANLLKGVQKKCATLANADLWFRGACANVDPEVVAACVSDAAICQACLKIEAFDGLDLDCDLADDGDNTNMSCP